MRTINYQRYIGLFAVACIVLYFVAPSRTSIKSIDEIYDELRACQLKGPSSTSNEFTENYRDCIAKYLPNFNFEYFNMGRFNEKKVFLPLVQESEAAKDCNFLTIGIGGDVLVETEFKLAHPECNVYGIEASSDQVAGFNDFGTVIPYGVGIKNETIELTLRKGGAYIKKEVKVVAMHHLLDKYVGSRFVHYATIDIEGAEFPILEGLLPGNALDNKDIVICQIDAELHNFSREGTEIIDLLKTFASDDSPYIPVVNAPFLTHQKVTFVNVKNNMCREAFDLDNIGL